MISVTDKSKCCGCGSCENICPAECIQMKEDGEGFLYPLVADPGKCVQCGLCERVCPCLNSREDVPFEQKGYIVRNKDSRILSESTSGGAFSAIAMAVLNKGGVVFGAAFDDHDDVRHICVSTAEELWRFRNSKYVQSAIRDAFRQVKDYIKKGKWVLFSGTPCQVEGLLSFLGKRPETLILVDVVCRAVPSPMIWRKYASILRAENKSQNEKTESKSAEAITQSSGDSLLFRDKGKYGYNYSVLSLKSKEGYKYARGIDSDPYLRAFFSNICDRPSCYSCMFKRRYRSSDYTLWDCYDADKFEKRFDDNRGVTKVLVHSASGMKLLEEIRNLNLIDCIETNPDELIGEGDMMLHSVPVNGKRGAFFRDANQLETKELFNRYFPIRAKNRLEHTARIILWKTGLSVKAKRAARTVIRWLRSERQF